MKNIKNLLEPTIDGPPILEKTKDIDDTLSPEQQNEREKHNRRFNTLVKKSGRVLLRANAIFPFDFFPDTLVIDESKVNIIHRIFFFTDEIQSILVPHIKDVLIDNSLLFSTLLILPDGFSENWVSIEHLWKKDAVRARRIILGLLVGYKEGVDITKVETENFAKKIEALGSIN